MSLVKRTRAVVAAPPEPFLETERSKSRVRDLIDSMPEPAFILNVGAGRHAYGDRQPDKLRSGLLRARKDDDNG